MKLSARIDDDSKCLETYFKKLFEIMHESLCEATKAPIESYDLESNESQATHYSFINLVKPDMLLNIVTA